MRREKVLLDIKNYIGSPGCINKASNRTDSRGLKIRCIELKDDYISLYYLLY